MGQKNFRHFQFSQLKMLNLWQGDFKQWVILKDKELTTDISVQCTMLYKDATSLNVLKVLISIFI